MFKVQGAFSGFSVNDVAKAESFYTGILNLQVENNGMGLQIHLPQGGTVFAYPKPDHQPATFTILNFQVDNIDDAVTDLMQRGVIFERYEGMPQDDKGIMRGRSQRKGPDIAWFKDPAGNILSVLQDK